MPIIKVWCLPSKQNEKKLNRLHKAIVNAVVSIKELGYKDQNDMICLFPPDLMKYGLGKEIVIEITGLYKRPEITHQVCQDLARVVSAAVGGIYTGTVIECSVQTLDPAGGFWRGETIGGG